MLGTQRHSGDTLETCWGPSECSGETWGRAGASMKWVGTGWEQLGTGPHQGDAEAPDVGPDVVVGLGGVGGIDALGLGGWGGNMAAGAGWH